MTHRNGPGRPSFFDENPEKERQLKELMKLRPRLKDAADFFELDPSTIEKFIKRKYELKFSEFRDRYMVETRFNIIRALLKSAEGGNVKAIELSLNYFLKWHNKMENESSGKIEINFVDAQKELTEEQNED